jgi:hypothetical protein
MLPSMSVSYLGKSRKRSNNPMSHRAETKVATAAPGPPRSSLRSIGSVTPPAERQNPAPTAAAVGEARDHEWTAAA